MSIAPRRPAGDTSTAEQRRLLKSISVASWLTAWASLVVAILGAIIFFRSLVAEQEMREQQEAAQRRIEAFSKQAIESIRRGK